METGAILADISVPINASLEVNRARFIDLDDRACGNLDCPCETNHVSKRLLVLLLRLPPKFIARQWCVCCASMGHGSDLTTIARCDRSIVERGDIIILLTAVCRNDQSVNPVGRWTLVSPDCCQNSDHLNHNIMGD